MLADFWWWSNIYTETYHLQLLWSLLIFPLLSKKLLILVVNVPFSQSKSGATFWKKVFWILTDSNVFYDQTVYVILNPVRLFNMTFTVLMFYNTEYIDVVYWYTSFNTGQVNFDLNKKKTKLVLNGKLTCDSLELKKG